MAGSSSNPYQDIIADGYAQVWVLDVGQGQAVWVKTAKHSLMYDAAPFMAGFDAGERIVVPVLRGFAQTHLDELLISHADADHAGGAQAILDAVQVHRVEHPSNFVAQVCTDKQWQWDGVWFWRWQWQDAQDSNQKSEIVCTTD